MSQKIELVSLAYKKYEPSGGADTKLSPVIFLHGSLASKENWIDIPQIVADKTKRTAFSVDARNHGDSPWNDFFTFDVNVDDLLYFMDSLSISKAVLVGHSMGGITSIRTALRAPERVESLIVEDMYAKKVDQDYLNMGVEFVRLFTEAIKDIPKDTPEDNLFSLMMDSIASKVPEPTRNLMKTEKNISGEIWPFNRDSDGAYSFKANTEVIIEAMKNNDIVMAEPEGFFDGPAYFIYGALSPFKVYEDEDNIKRLFSKAELIAVENADHSIHLQYTEKFTELLLKYI